ncbi:mycofactocin biosynthesis glycosyltransferase MftF [Aeromicrobium chenweiae]|uniref:Mycofactocin system glycosyltransferase n=1 Tax=Aeromicrobium chenweiae TaxID=2079793 RepID=A0A2S0WQ56_9ACTN|nr:mycofactocin biosynthesis glycosyltransferase MftF [Aeromicrobium chenweiae]AWB93489.1 mycofactocin system glycosyltransferase [Aeromicrobium chenweiae]TGN34482.1 mycofactocin system glycosyltransferase [Aeromicrobium chenweiae]
MTPGATALPDGFAVRLHDDVELGPVVPAGWRFLRLSATARSLLADRSLVVSSPVTAMLAARLLDLDLADPVPDVGAAPGPDSVTVVVPVKDNARGVDRLLTSLSGHVACVVVDDGSADPRALAQVVERHGAALVRLDRNVGPAAARDAGLRSVRTPLVAFVDSDVEVAPSALGQLAAHFADPGLAAAAPRIRSHGGTRWFERYDDAMGSLDLGPRSATVRPWSPVAYVPSACLVARVELLGDGFDPRLRCGEDVDLVWRLHDAGHRVRYVAEVEVGHEVRRTVRSWLGRKAFYGTSAALLAQRHGDKVAPAILSPTSTLTVAGVLLQRRWSWAIAAGLSAWTLHDAGRRLPELSFQQRLGLARTADVALAKQASGLALRHWWPVTAVLAVVSPRARRAVAVMVLADGVATHRSSGTDLDVLRFTLARRADDLAYGAGVWWGAVRERSVACLLPRRDSVVRGGPGR